MPIKITKPKPPQVVKKDEAEKDAAAAGQDASNREFEENERELAERDEAAAEEPANAPPADAPQAPKTSPSPYLGMPVLFRTQDKQRQHNGSDTHPGVITRVWERCVNIKVFPDCGAPYDATSQKRIAYSDVNGTGWFTIDEARSA